MFLALPVSPSHPLPFLSWQHCSSWRDVKCVGEISGNPFRSNRYSRSVQNKSRGPIASVTRVNSILHKEKRHKPEEIILYSNKYPDGTTEKIVFATGGDIDVYDVQSLFVKVGWNKRSPLKIARSLKNSYMVASLHLTRQSLDTKNEYHRELIGFAHAISDHAIFATIEDVMVDPRYQGRGFGKALLEQTIRSLCRSGIENIFLFSSANAIRFFQNLGFEIESRDAQGMIWYSKT